VEDVPLVLLMVGPGLGLGVTPASSSDGPLGPLMPGLALGELGTLGTGAGTGTGTGAIPGACAGGEGLGFLFSLASAKNIPLVCVCVFDLELE